MCTWFFPLPHPLSLAHAGGAVSEKMKQVRGQLKHVTASKGAHGHTRRGCTLCSGCTPSPAVALTPRQAFQGRTNTSQGFLKGELSASENACGKPPTDRTESFTGTSHFFELTFLEKFALQTPGNPCTLNQTPF